MQADRTENQNPVYGTDSWSSDVCSSDLIRRTNPGSVNTAISGKENGKDAARKNVITSSRRKTADQEPFIGRMKPETARDARMAGTPPASVTASGKSCWK